MLRSEVLAISIKIPSKEVYAPHFKDENVIETKKGDILLQIWVNSRHQDTSTVDISYASLRLIYSNDPLHRSGRGL
jgi:hypothetical protein